MTLNLDLIVPGLPEADLTTYMVQMTLLLTNSERKLKELLDNVVNKKKRPNINYNETMYSCQQNGQANI